MGDFRAFVKMSTEKNAEKVGPHLKYIGFRSQEQGYEKEMKGFFDEQRDRVTDYKALEQSVRHDRALQHHSSVKIHKFVISFRREDYEKLGLNEGRMKEVARVFMQKLELEKGMKLEWVGAIHLKSDHPHIHLVVKSVGRDDFGNGRRLHINIKEDISELKKEIHRFTGRDEILNQERRERQMEREMAKEDREAAKELVQVGKELSSIISKWVQEGEQLNQGARNQVERASKREADRGRDR